jgi:hypothetical protein
MGDVMSDGLKTNDDGSPGFKNEATGTYKSSTDALKEIRTAFDYWSGQLTATSLQMCYGLIAANWVVFGSVGNILHSGYAVASLFLVMLALTFNMVSAYGLAEYMRAGSATRHSTQSVGRRSSSRRKSSRPPGLIRTGPKGRASQPARSKSFSRWQAEFA